MPRQLKLKMTYKTLKKNSDDSADELNFSDDQSTPSFRDLTPDADTDWEDDEDNLRAKGRGEPTEDDLAPEILIREDGALSPREAGDDKAADQTLTLVSADKIGAGRGLDEAELAQVDPIKKTAKRSKSQRKAVRTPRR